MSDKEKSPGVGVPSGVGFRKRALARLIDIGFGYVLALLGGSLGGGALAVLEMTGRAPPGWAYRIDGLTLPWVGLGIVGGVVYHSVCEGVHGASLGKWICHLRVVRQDGRPSDMGSALVRTFGWFVDALFFGAIAYLSMDRSRHNQRYGDSWGQTVVVRSKDLPGAHARTSRHFLVGLSVGSAFWTLAFAVAVILQGM